jgi:SAM-dependent methyltransferase
MSSNLYDYPALYDALFPIRAHAPWYVELARQASGIALELACGTGQLAVPIAEAGLPITGVDLSEPMLAAARKRAADAGVPVEFLLGDMRNFDAGRQFALIIIARNSLLHLHSTQDILAAFRMVRRNLAPGGMFAFDIFNPSVAILARPPEQRFPLMRMETESFGTLTVEGTNDYDSAAQVNRGSVYVSAPGKPDAWILSVALRSIFPQELPLLLEAAGLHLKIRAGDLSQTPFGSTSPLQVCVSHAAV